MTSPHASTDYRFAPIPEDLLYDTALTPLAVRIYGALMRHGLDPSSCYPSHARLGQLVGVSERSVQRPVKDLEAAGWISKVRRKNDRGERMTDAYHVYTQPRTTARPTAPELPLDHRAEPAETHRAETSDKREPVTPNESNNTPAPNGAKQQADALTRDIWDAKKARGEPTPASFVGARGVIEKLLTAGWPAPKVVAAAMKAPTISIAAMEFQLNGRTTNRQARSASNAQAIAAGVLGNGQKQVGP